MHIKTVLMKYIIFCIFFAFSGVLIAQENVHQPDGSIIPWKSSVRLSWNDFQCEEEPEVYARAMTGYKIDIFPLEVMVDEFGRIQGYEKLTVKAQFYKNHSWTSTQNVFLLEHEQLHFDIAELYARKIRKRFAELKSVEETRFSEYQENYSLLWSQCRNYQRLYDKETESGQNLKVNQEWNQRIFEELEELNTYE